MLGYLPPVFHEVKEMIEIAKIENPVLQSLWVEIEDAINNQFILTANESGADRYEKMLKISVPNTDTLETRRFRILTRFNEQAPYTYRVLKQLLDSLLGEGQYVMKRDIVNKTLSVKLELTVKGMFDAVVAMLERITPQNMVLTVELRYNQHNTLSRYTHAQLTRYTHDQLRNEVLN
ncbi:putative phage tail protein [Viridibacillus arvi]|uniref:putative phage tail protein n=1 Tax=Viridibacillus arvi TaxID=263475 RepID=UPI003D299B9D